MIVPECGGGSRPVRPPWRRRGASRRDHPVQTDYSRRGLSTRFVRVELEASLAAVCIPIDDAWLGVASCANIRRNQVDGTKQRSSASGPPLGLSNHGISFGRLCTGPLLDPPSFVFRACLLNTMGFQLPTPFHSCPRAPTDQPIESRTDMPRLSTAGPSITHTSLLEWRGKYLQVPVPAHCRSGSAVSIATIICRGRLTLACDDH